MRTNFVYFTKLIFIGKAINYTKDGRSDGNAKSNLFMMNNAFYLLDEFRLATRNFNQISDNILVDSIKTFDYLYKLEIIINDLFRSLSSIQMFHRTKQ